MTYSALFTSNGPEPNSCYSFSMKNWASLTVRNVKLNLKACFILCLAFGPEGNQPNWTFSSR